MKTVLHIAEAPGGIERYLVTLLTKLKKYTEYNQILVCSTRYDIEKFEGLVQDVIVINEMNHSISLFQSVKAIKAVRKAIKLYKPDVVYCHSSIGGAIGRLSDLGINNKLIYNAHGWSFNMKGESARKIKIYEFVEKMLALTTDKIICVSEYEKKSALEHNICGVEKLAVINNGIDFDEFRGIHLKSRVELRIPENAFVVGMIGRLAEQKAPDVFIKMARQVKEQIQEAFFIIVGDDIGDGKYRKQTEDWIRNAELEDYFLITGWVNDPIEYLDVFDVGVLLSRWEGFGLVLPEYMYMGKPIVASKADAIPYVVGDAGLLVDVDDYKQAATKVVSLYYDDKIRERIVKKGRERVKIFDSERTAEAHISTFMKISDGEDNEL